MGLEEFSGFNGLLFTADDRGISLDLFKDGVVLVDAKCLCKYCWNRSKTAAPNSTLSLISLML